MQLQQVVINLALNAIQAMDAVPEERRRLAIGIAPQAPEAEGAGGIAITMLTLIGLAVVAVLITLGKI